MADSNVFDAHYTAMHPGEVDRLYQQSVSLVGITTPIVDHASNKTLNAHAHFQSHAMTILG
jgi:kynurenine formamidase